MCMVPNPLLAALTCCNYIVLSEYLKEKYYINMTRPEPELCFRNPYLPVIKKPTQLGFDRLKTRRVGLFATPIWKGGYCHTLTTSYWLLRVSFCCVFWAFLKQLFCLQKTHWTMNLEWLFQAHGVCSSFWFNIGITRCVKYEPNALWQVYKVLPLLTHF